MCGMLCHRIYENVSYGQCQLWTIQATTKNDSSCEFVDDGTL